jgi:hypothetical protein
LLATHDLAAARTQILEDVLQKLMIGSGRETPRPESVRIAA